MVPGCPPPGQRASTAPPAQRGLSSLAKMLCLSLAAQLPPKRVVCFHGKQPKLPSLPKRHLRTVPATQRNGGAGEGGGCLLLAGFGKESLQERCKKEDMITSAILVAITGM